MYNYKGRTISSKIFLPSLFLLLYTVFACETYTRVDKKADNSSPMYGDGKFTTDQKIANKNFIQYAIMESGSRKKASVNCAELGWSYYYKKESVTSMKRFNQAWLLDPLNPSVYHGFGVLLGDSDKLNEAIEMFDKALRLNPNDPSILGDKANAYVHKAQGDGNPIESGRSIYYRKAETLFKKAAKNGASGCLYAQWAKLSYYQNDCTLCFYQISIAKSLIADPKECSFIEEHENLCEICKK